MAAGDDRDTDKPDTDTPDNGAPAAPESADRAAGSPPSGAAPASPDEPAPAPAPPGHHSSDPPHVADVPPTDVPPTNVPPAAGAAAPGSAVSPAPLEAWYVRLRLKTLLSVLGIAFGLGGILYVASDQLLVAWNTKRYVREIGAAFDLNDHLTQVLLLVMLAVVGYFIKLCVSINEKKRKIGEFGILVLLVGNSLALWYASRSKLDGKCYVITRTGITYGEHIGTDPATGRECVEIKKDMRERLRAYETGKRPTRIVSDQPDFFDPRNGEPIVWYLLNASGEIELFDLMGFHPVTGEVLNPITKDVVARWKAAQEARNALPQRPPQRVDPDGSGYFDPQTGAAKVWFAPRGDDAPEFFDSPGFHPVTGERLQVVTREMVTAWRAEAEEKARKEEDIRRQREKAAREAADQAAKKKEEERIAAEKRELEQKRNEIELQRIATERQRIESERQRRDADRQAKLQRSGERCDQLAANPNDQRRGTTVGVPYEVLKSQAREAVAACDDAKAAFPDEPRYRYQYARAMQFIDKGKAFELQRLNARNDYPAAFDNLGWLYVVLKQDYAQAARNFIRGVQLGDPDSMMSLAELISTGRYKVNQPAKQVLDLYARAAELGHPRAAEAYRETKAAIDEQVQRAQRGQRVQGQMIDIFGRMISNIPPH